MTPGADADAGEPEVVVVESVDELAQVAADRFVKITADALEQRGRADIALTGGSTAPLLYRRLAEPAVRERIGWDRVHLWWGDDRFVPRDHPLSNVLPAGELLRELLPIDHVHPFPTTAAIGEARGPAWCAATYAEEVVGAVPLEDRWPRFDLVLVGVGPDGHVLSVFPNGEPLSSDRVGLAVPAPATVEPRVERVTLNPAILVVAGSVIVMAAGSAKADVVGRVLDGARDPAALPAAVARRATATWILDRAAAARRHL